MPLSELDPEERADAEAAIAAEAAIEGPPAFETSVKIYRTAPYILLFIGLVLTLSVALLGSYLGAALIVLAGLLVIMAVPKPVVRYRFDEDGRLYPNDGSESIDWQKVTQLRVRYWSEPLTPDTRFTRPFRRLDVRFEFADSSKLRFARGDHFEQRPSKRPLRPGRFEAWLKRVAQAAGLRIEPVPGFRGGWDARR